MIELHIYQYDSYILQLLSTIDFSHMSFQNQNVDYISDAAFLFVKFGV